MMGRLSQLGAQIVPQLQNLVLTDRATTPVNHTFTPSGIDPKTGVAEVVETNGTPVGEPRYTIAMRKNGSRAKASVKFVVPVVQTQTINGIATPVVVRTTYVTAEFSFDLRSSAQERKDAVGMFYSSLASGATLVNDTLVNLQGIY